MNNMNHDELIAWLYRTIDNELEKPDDEMDCYLIAECSDFLDELTADQSCFSEEEVRKKIKEIHAKAVNQKEKDTGDIISQNKPIIKKLGFKHRRIIWIAIIAALIIFSTVTVTATTGIFSAGWDYISTNIQKIIAMKPGERIESDGITIIKNHGAKTYSSIEELLSSENLDILYPTVLPDGIKIKEITQLMEDEDKCMHIFQFTSDNLYFSVFNYYNNSPEEYEDFTKYETAYITFYIENLPDNTYLAIGQKDGYEYQVIFSDYKELISILENMKGL